MKTSDKRSVSRLVEICYRMGVRNIVFSPGSRNAPLVISFVESGQFNCLTIPDERTAAFFALGMSLASSKATAICCTSGSAALNYAPAISEAYYQGVPLLVLTADRPVEWIDQGVGQSIRQKDVYANYVKKSYQLLQEAVDEEDLKINDRICVEAIREAHTGFMGPVHINIPLKEPLYGTREFQEKVDIDSILPGGDNLSHIDTAHFRRIWSSSSRKIILVGLESPDRALQDLLQYWQDSNQLVVLTETASNCYVNGAVQTIDRLITGFENDGEAYKADLLISIGGPIVSKKIKAFFLKNKPEHHWYVSEDRIKDSYRALTAYVPMKALDFLSRLKNDASLNADEFQALWLDYNRQLLPRHDAYIKACRWSDLKLFSYLLAAIPSDAVLHMGNSTVVRYVQLFDQQKDVAYFGNRGVSGIDGCSSTALGYASISDRKNILITGDIAFYYDANAFWHKHLPDYFRIILVNNQGGSIFRIIPGPSSTSQLKEYFESYQEKTAEQLCLHHGIDYSSAQNEQELKEALDEFFDDESGIKLLEVFTPREENDRTLMAYFEFLHDL